MKFNFFGKNKGNRVGGDCECGCCKEARDSVRLTDFEIAEDILGELKDLEHSYKCLCSDGCECAEKLKSVEEDKQCFCDFVHECKCGK